MARLLLSMERWGKCQRAVLDKVAGNGAMRLGRLKEKISFFRAVRW